MINCFVFDIQGVIVTTSKATFARLEAEGYDKEKLSMIEGTTGPVGTPYYRGKISYDEYVKGVQELFPNDYKYILEAYFQEYNLKTISKTWLRENVLTPFNIPLTLDKISDSITTLSFIQALYNADHPLAVFSGNSKERLQLFSDRFHFLDYFTYKLFSYQVGIDKPDPKFFEAILNMIPYPPSECLFLDDGAKNIEVGKECGMQAVLVP